MTLQKFRLAYLLVVVLTVTTVYAIADFNQVTPLELSDSEMQELSGAASQYRARCKIQYTGLNCPTGCTDIDAVVISHPVAEKVKRNVFWSSTYRCESTQLYTFCNRSSYEKWCTFRLYDDNECLQAHDIGHKDANGYTDCVTD